MKQRHVGFSGFSPEELQAKAKERREQRVAAGLCAQRNPLEAYLDDPVSRAKAINAHCWQCMGEGADSGWRWMIGNCQIDVCALHRFRPYRNLHGTPAQGVAQIE